MLDEAVMHLLPTSWASDGEKGGPNQRGSSGDLMMPSAALLLPTPEARDWKAGDSNIMDRNARPLNEVVQNLLPTPRAMDSCATPEAPGAARHVAAGNGSLVEVIGVYLMPGGDAGPTPSDAGNDSPDLPLTLWSWDDEETGA